MLLESGVIAVEAAEMRAWLVTILDTHTPASSALLFAEFKVINHEHVVNAFFGIILLV
jgi:hypothetical protein